MAVFPARLPFKHFKWEPEAGKDAHGNAKGALSETPIERRAICFYTANSQQSSTQEPVSPETVARYVNNLVILVKNSTLFSERDEVEIHGVRFQVVGDALSGDWRDGPWPRYSRLFGGQVKATRVG